MERRASSLSGKVAGWASACIQNKSSAFFSLLPSPLHQPPLHRRKKKQHGVSDTRRFKAKKKTL